MSKEKEQELMRALLQVFQDWPDSKARPVSWDDLAERLPEPLRYSPEVLQFYTVRCEHWDYLSEVSREGDTFQVGELTRDGKRVVKKGVRPYGGLAYQHAMVYLFMAVFMLLVLAYSLWWYFR